MVNAEIVKTRFKNEFKREKFKQNNQNAKGKVTLPTVPFYLLLIPYFMRYNTKYDKKERKQLQKVNGCPHLLFNA